MTALRFAASLLFPERAPEAAGAMCCRCHKWTYAPVPIRYFQRPGGAGVTRYACPSHATEFVPAPTSGELDRSA